MTRSASAIIKSLYSDIDVNHYLMLHPSNEWFTFKSGSFWFTDMGVQERKSRRLPLLVRYFQVLLSTIQIAGFFDKPYQGIFYKFRSAFDIGQKGQFFRKKGHFFWKMLPYPTPFPYSIPFLIVLHQIKVLHHFWKMGQCSIVQSNHIAGLLDHKYFLN